MNLSRRVARAQKKTKSASYVLSAVILLFHSNLAMAQTVPLTGPDVVAAAPGNPVQGSQLPQTPASTILPSSITNALNPEPVFLDMAQHNGTLSFSGDFVNSSNLTLYTSNPAFSSITISAANIINSQGATISTVLPACGYAGAINAPLNLVLNATNGIFNAGTIASSGSLSMNAQVIANVVASPNFAPPVIQSVDTVSMMSSTIINQGIITSALSNINIAG